MTASILDSIRERRVFGLQRRLVRLAPFGAAYLAAAVAYPFGPTPTYGWAFAGAAMVAAATLAAIAFAPWERLSAWTNVLPLLLYLLSVALLREAHGGAESGYAPMLMLAAVWAGVFAAPAALVAVVAAVGLTIALPPFVLTEADYPSGELRRALLTVLLAATVAVVIRLLVHAVVTEFERREQVEQRLNKLRGSEIHDDIVQSLAAAQIGLTIGDRETADRAIGHALASAQGLVAELDAGDAERATPGALRRETASAVPADEG